MVSKYKRVKAKATNENLSAVKMMSGKTTAGSSRHHSDLHRQWPTRIPPSTYQPKPPSSDHRWKLSLCAGRNQALAWQTFIASSHRSESGLDCPSILEEKSPHTFLTKL